MKELTREDWIRIVVLVLAIVLGLVAAYFAAGAVVFWIAALIIATVFALVAGWPMLPSQLRGSAGTGIPPELNPILVEHIDHAKGRIAQAETNLRSAEAELTNAKAAAKAAAEATTPDPVVIRDTIEKTNQAQQAVTRARAVVGFEQSQLENLLNPGPWRWFGGNWVQYLIFGSLAAFVLYKLMEGITNSPPAGTTPRGMITLLISVVTVGIALILVLSTIVSESLDEKRFSQGKEVLTALLGVLGTIVGFYFGTTQDQASVFNFEPAVVQVDGDTVTMLTKAIGGKPPYSFEATFTPATIPPVPGNSDNKGGIKVVFDGKKLAADADVTVVIRAKDSAGKTGEIEYKDVIHLKAGGKKKDGS